MAATQLRVPLPASGANTRLVLAASSRQASMPDWLAAGVSAGFVPNVCAPRVKMLKTGLCGQMIGYCGDRVNAPSSSSHNCDVFLCPLSPPHALNGPPK
jgi:hypothetical protein